MQASDSQQGVKDLASRIISLDPVEYSSAVNQYFEANAVLENKTIYLAGSSRIKKMAYLQSILASDSKLVGEPRYDERNNIIDLSFQRTYTAPRLPAYIPLASAISGKQKILHYSARLHLLPNVGPDGEVLYVTKVSDLQRTEKFPLEHLVPFWLLRPVVTFLAIFLAIIVSFVSTHRKDGPVGFIAAAGVEVVDAVWGFVLAETGRKRAEADQWTAHKSAQLDKFIDQAKTTATDGIDDIQLRAQNAGVPVDSYKQQAGSAIGGLADQAGAVVSGLRRRAAAATGYLVNKKDDATAQAKDASNGLVNGAKNNAQYAANKVQGAAGNAKGSAKGMANETFSQIHNASTQAKGQAYGAADMAATKARDAAVQIQDGAAETDRTGTNGSYGTDMIAPVGTDAVTNDLVNDEGVPTPFVVGHDPMKLNVPAPTYAQVASE